MVPKVESNEAKRERQERASRESTKTNLSPRPVDVGASENPSLRTISPVIPQNSCGPKKKPFINIHQVDKIVFDPEVEK